MKPREVAASSAASSRRIASRAVERTEMNASSAPIANAAIAMPSMTAYGSVSMRVRSVVAAGSAP